MRIAISLLASASYGAFTSAQNLISTIARLESEHNFLFLVRPEIFEKAYLDASNVQFIECPMAAKGPFNRLVWEHFFLNQRLADWKTDILFVNMGTVPFNMKVPYIIAPQNMETVFYDSFINQCTRRIKNRILLKWTYRSAEKAVGIVAVSNFVRETLIKKASIPADKIRTIYPGCPAYEQCDQVEFADFCKEKGIKGDFILTASKFIPYSNLHRLIKGYLLASSGADSMPPLVVAGGDQDLRYRHQIEMFIRKNEMGERVKLLDLVPHQILMGLMKACRFFCFPSLLEACPFTMLECFSTGTFILSSSAPPMPEIGGDAAMYFDPYSVKDIANTLLRAVQCSEQEIEYWRTKRLKQMQKFKWKDHISSLIEMINDILITPSSSNVSP